LEVVSLTNPSVTYGSCFVDDFLVDTDFRIHASPLEGVQVMISELAVTQFSLTIYESTGAVGAEESTHHLCNQFR
jgi:hypothetical protein